WAIPCCAPRFQNR
ncbi:alanine-glyoxylate amino-transferase family protein, partial [Vibrio parahaemolyticus V-223/04]